PASSNFSVQYDAKQSGKVTIRITDINGKLISTIHETVNKGQNIIYIQSQPSWMPGTYVITAQQGSDVQKGKLMKIK
ncbi:MAG TPA: T9SS type A sorting domain-containing protein, partial [Chitinophagaceae bacterium]|nr:T9SS type A sorting domain-containing protein [Chitinophagaceae bacterium]